MNWKVKNGWRIGINMADDKKPFRKLTYRLAIRAKCMQCSVGSPKEVKECPVKTCALYPFRLGKQPAEPVNALELLVFDDVPTSVIFRARKPKDENDDGISTVRTEYAAYIEDDDEEDEVDDD